MDFSNGDDKNESLGWWCPLASPLTVDDKVDAIAVAVAGRLVRIDDDDNVNDNVDECCFARVAAAAAVAPPPPPRGAWITHVGGGHLL